MTNLIVLWYNSRCGKYLYSAADDLGNQAKRALSVIVVKQWCEHDGLT